MQILPLLPALPLLTGLSGAAGALLLSRRRTALAWFVPCTLLAGLLISAMLLHLCIVENRVLSVVLGGWEAPYGIVLTIDGLAALLITLTWLLGLAGWIGARQDLGEQRLMRNRPLFYLGLMGAVSGAFSVGDLFTLFVFFELFLIASFALVALSPGSGSPRAAWIYLWISLFGSALFLLGAGVAYRGGGSLNLAALTQAAQEAGPHAAWPHLATAFLFGSFATKAGAFPLFFWLPTAYRALPMSWASVFAGLLTKVGVYALLRLYLMWHQPDGLWSEVMIALAIVTMLTGVIAAAGQVDLRHILAFHISSQVGYMLLGVGLGGRLAIAGAVFYLAHHILVKASLYLVGGLLASEGRGFRLKNIGGRSSRHLWMVLFLVPALSLVGVPPLSGFWAKWALVLAGWESGAYGAVIAAVLTGFLTLFSMHKIYDAAFLQAYDQDAHRAPAEPDSAGPQPRLSPLAVAALILILPSLLLGLGAGATFPLALAVADQLLTVAAGGEATLP